MSADEVRSTVRDEVLFVLLGNLVRQRDGEDQRGCLRGFQNCRSFDLGDDFTKIRAESIEGTRNRKRDHHRYRKRQRPLASSNSSHSVSWGLRTEAVGWIRMTKT